MRINQELYPFRSQYLEVKGGRLHYIDEGPKENARATIVMVHGTPVWSFVFRHLITAFSVEHRVIAMDHIGFGLSSKPEHWGYRPVDHAENLRLLIEHLGLSQIVLVVHDFGGPIGLSMAIEKPELIDRLILFNTWMWSLKGTPAENLGNLLGGKLGKWLYTKCNFSSRVLLPMVWADKSRLTAEIKRHYVEAWNHPAERTGTWALARELNASSQWYEDLWNRRQALVDKPALLLWGMQDRAFRQDALAKWQTALPKARTVCFSQSGHFVMEENPDQAVAEMKSFLASSSRVRSSG